MTHTPDFGAKVGAESRWLGAENQQKNTQPTGASRLRPAQDQYDTQSRNRRRFSAPTGADLRRRNLGCVSSSLVLPLELNILCVVGGNFVTVKFVAIFFDFI